MTQLPQGVHVMHYRACASGGTSALIKTPMTSIYCVVRWSAAVAVRFCSNILLGINHIAIDVYTFYIDHSLVFSAAALT
jgi:hypothetical protein